ncbi:MAG: DNA repair protein RecO [Leptolyngbyaceae cyanobacterium RU_5_1]|nr:DNA repair protein RecO [Leptolyngbyaceae cyanobacterium RU_5_1]
MSRTYKATGINLKSMPLGEADRLLTILTREYGLVKAVAMGSRKHNSKLGGRSGLFVVNELLIAKGRSLDKITQAETVESYPGLGQDLKKLTASQYIAELCLCQALSDQPQEELFQALNGHLKRLERSSTPLILPHLTHAIFQFLILEGVAPQVDRCCVTRQPLIPEFDDPNWRVGFSVPAGGAVTLEALRQLQQKSQPSKRLPAVSEQSTEATRQAISQIQDGVAETETSDYTGSSPMRRSAQLNRLLTAAELTLLQAVAQACSSERMAVADHPQVDFPSQGSLHFLQLPTSVDEWLAIERILRPYAQYHFDRPIRSAALMDACFLSSSAPP